MAGLQARKEGRKERDSLAEVEQRKRGEENLQEGSCPEERKWSAGGASQLALRQASCHLSCFI